MFKVRVNKKKNYFISFEQKFVLIFIFALKYLLNKYKIISVLYKPKKKKRINNSNVV